MCKIIFFVNKIFLLLPVVRLALMFFIYMVYFIFLTLYFFSTLVCANLVGKRFGRFACFNLRSTFIEAFPWSLCSFYGLFDHSFVDWKDFYFQRCRLI